jgi:uncharacterized membrane protein (Fun14 family)
MINVGYLYDYAVVKIEVLMRKVLVEVAISIAKLVTSWLHIKLLPKISFSQSFFLPFSSLLRSGDEV